MDPGGEGTWVWHPTSSGGAPTPLEIPQVVARQTATPTPQQEAGCNANGNAAAPSAAAAQISSKPGTPRPPPKPPSKPSSRKNSRQGSRPGSRQVVSRPGSSAGMEINNRPASRQGAEYLVPRPNTVMAMSRVPIPEEGGAEHTLAAEVSERPGTAEPPSMLGALLNGHHRFDGSGWKQLCDSYNTQAQTARKFMQQELKDLDRDREKERAKEALSEAIHDLKSRVSAHKGRRQKLATMLQENDQTFRDKLLERRTRSQRVPELRGAGFGNLTTGSTFGKSTETGGASTMSEAAESAVARSTPWSEHRALTDRPSREDQMRRQRMYKDMLDQQIAAKTAKKTQERQADRDLERTTNTSLYSPSHIWEERPWERYVDLDSNQYKVDLLRAKAWKEKREKEHVILEREQYSTWVSSELKHQEATRAKAERKRLSMNERLVDSWDVMVARKSEKRSALRQEELKNDKDLLGGTFRQPEERTRLLRKPRPIGLLFS